MEALSAECGKLPELHCHVSMTAASRIGGFLHVLLIRSVPRWLLLQDRIWERAGRIASDRIRSANMIKTVLCSGVLLYHRAGRRKAGTAVLWMVPEEAIYRMSSFSCSAILFYFPLSLVNNIPVLIRGMGYSMLAILSGVSEMIAKLWPGLFRFPVFGFCEAVGFASPLAWVMAMCS